MHHLDLLVPAALVEPALAAELLKGIELPALARLVARGAAPVVDTVSRPALLTPWQRWLFEIRAPAALSSSVSSSSSTATSSAASPATSSASAPPSSHASSSVAAATDRAGAPPAVNIAELWAMACGLAPRPHGGRWLVEPAHFTVARDHLRLDDPRRLAWTLDEARALAEVATPVLADAGWTLEPIEPTTLRRWFVHRDDAADLAAPALDCAIGVNVAHWQPRAIDASAAGERLALAWRRCVNEIQMLWYAHPVNDAREARGDAPLNTLWLSGNGAARSPLPRYRAVDSSLALPASLPIEPDAPRALETFDALIDPSRTEDWGVWRDRVAGLDTRIAAAVDAQRRGDVDTLTLVLCGTRVWTSYALERGGFAKLLRRWRRPAPLTDLFAEPA